MAKRHKQGERNTNTVQTLENDYVRSNATKANGKLSKQQIIRRRRRMLAFFAVASVVIVLLSTMVMKQNERLAVKEQKKETVIAELENVKETQEMLNLQITKLEDDDYIAKLARKEYFMSEEGEIIFTIPKEEKAKDEQED
ncbi:septum formation initiator family protein [Solibacillus sp. CAU 1738]|uniref:FtsB family cell division protein n=1 Tax=Solibacillus sp. CAU 1738 TaxID=3140363 RepID=UPI00325FFE58